MKRVVAAAAFCVCIAAPAWAADATLTIDGLVAHPAKLSLDDLKKLPPTELDVTFQTGHGPEGGHFTGVLLWSLLDQAHLTDDKGKHADLHHTALATGSDGYVIAFSFGELDPDFGGKTAIIAYADNGKPLDTPRLIIPGDKLGARDVHDLVRIEVK
ncbi:MAG TPA: molybdopterin-dependent oxidoreductase [Magnetospirillaceae bacterium]|jgi:DMSO/TMAO reductase YedYZ molybdopterin-dependent catalytic subunit